MDRLKSLEIFQAVADQGSFVRAADALALSNAVVTRAVQELERLLGVRLLQRTTRCVSLTPEGEDVLERTRRLLESFDELAATSGLRAGRVAGDIRFTGPASFASQLGPVLADFAAEHPQVRLQWLATDAPLDLVAERIDLALRIARELPDTLVARRLPDVAIGVYGSPAYLARRGTPRHPAELERHDCLVHGSTGRDAAWRFIHPVTQEAMEATVRGALCANNADALMATARRDAGLALLPQPLARAAVAAGELQQVLNAWPCPPLAMALVYPSRRHQPLRVRKLIEHLVQACHSIVESPRAHSGSGPYATSSTRCVGFMPTMNHWQNGVS